jgi:hypothetical protein
VSQEHEEKPVWQIGDVVRSKQCPQFEPLRIAEFKLTPKGRRLAKLQPLWAPDDFEGIHYPIWTRGLDEWYMQRVRPVNSEDDHVPGQQPQWHALPDPECG